MMSVNFKFGRIFILGTYPYMCRVLTLFMRKGFWSYLSKIVLKVLGCAVVTVFLM